MSKIILFGNRKGGVGKSTCTVLAANALSEAPFNYRILVVDMDEQQTIGKNFDRAESGSVKWDMLSMPSPDPNSGEWEKFLSYKKEFDKKYDLIFLDVPGRITSKETKEYKAILAADFIFVPFAPTVSDWDGTQDYLKLILENRKAAKKGFELVTFCNRFHPRRKKSRQVKKDMAGLQEFGVKVMHNHINYYEAISDVEPDRNLFAETDTAIGLNIYNWVNEMHLLIK